MSSRSTDWESIRLRSQQVKRESDCQTAGCAGSSCDCIQEGREWGEPGSPGSPQWNHSGPAAPASQQWGGELLPGFFGGHFLYSDTSAVLQGRIANVPSCLWDLLTSVQFRPDPLIPPPPVWVSAPVIQDHVRHQSGCVGLNLQDGQPPLIHTYRKTDVGWRGQRNLPRAGFSAASSLERKPMTPIPSDYITQLPRA